MNSLAIGHPLARAERKPQPARRNWCAVAHPLGTVIGLAGGFVAGLAGLLLTAASWLATGANTRALLARAGTALLVAMIPLLILGASCLDCIDGNQQTARTDAMEDEEDDER